MQQHDLRPAAGSTKKRKRVGRGNASGHGTYATRGLKGQKARSGGGVRPHFEGGQLPFVRRMAYKRGFRNPFRVEYQAVNVGELARFDAGSEVTPETLRSAGLVTRGKPVKVLAEGELTIALTVEADRFSKAARGKIEAAGGTVRWIGGEPPAEEEEAAPSEATKIEAAAEEKPARSRKKKEPEAEASAEDPGKGEDGDGASS